MATASPIFDAQTRLVDQQNERIVQQHKMIEIDAARPALEQQIAQTRAAYEHQVLNDLSDAEKKVAEFSRTSSRPNRKSTSRSCDHQSTAPFSNFPAPAPYRLANSAGFRTSGG